MLPLSCLLVLVLAMAVRASFVTIQYKVTGKVQGKSGRVSASFDALDTRFTRHGYVTLVSSVFGRGLVAEASSWLY